MIEFIEIDEVHFAESVLVGRGDSQKYINVNLPNTNYIRLYLTPTLLWINNKKENKWSATSTANLRLLVPKNPPQELIDDIRRGISSTRADKESENKTTIKVDQKPRVSRSK